MGAYVLLYDIEPEGTLRYRSATRVDDPDVNGAGPDSAMTWPTTVLIHPDGTHAYVTVHDQANGTHHLVLYEVDPDEGTLSHVSTMRTATSGGSHHGGVLAPGPSGDRLFLYAYVTNYADAGGVLEGYEIDGDHILVPLTPTAFVTGPRDARHPVAIHR